MEEPDRPVDPSDPRLRQVHADPVDAERVVPLGSGRRQGAVETEYADRSATAGSRTSPTLSRNVRCGATGADRGRGDVAQSLLEELAAEQLVEDAAGLELSDLAAVDDVLDRRAPVHQAVDGGLLAAEPDPLVVALAVGVFDQPEVDVGLVDGDRPVVAQDGSPPSA